MSSSVPQPFNQPKQSSKNNDKALPNELLLMYRKRSGWTQAELAQQVGLEGSRGIRNWETGVSLPRAERLMRLIELYLAHNVFIQGHEHEEAQKLWQTIKDMFDTNTSKLDTYPVFDENWFDAVWQTYRGSSSQETRRKAKANLQVLPFKTAGTKIDALKVESNLPITSGTFVGRAKALLTTKALLQSQSVRVLTLTGTGGSGKTRLAIQIATELLPVFANKVYFVSLVTARDFTKVMEMIGSVFGLVSTPNLAEQLQQMLRPHQVLLVLDNFEHLLEVAALLQQWLEALPNLSLLVTSRQKLSVAREYEFVVLPLEVPNLKRLPPLPELLENEAVSLFVQRARQAQPDFKLDATNSQTLAEICSRLDGLPLAIELAAARIQSLTPALVLANLQNANRMLNLLATNTSQLPLRQQTLRYTLQWSYDLLNANEQRLFRSLGMFVGGCDIEAIEAISESSEQAQNFFILDILESLVSKSLLTQNQVVTPRGYAESRFGMLETIREFALEKLVAVGEFQQLSKKHAQYFEALAEKGRMELVGTNQILWLEEFEREHPNFRAALIWSLENEPIIALRIGGFLAPFWDLRGHVSEGLHWLELAIAANPDAPAATLGTAVNAAGSYARMLGDYSRSLELRQQALKLYLDAGIKHGIAVMMGNLGELLCAMGELEQAHEILNDCLAIKRELGNQQSLFFTLNKMGEVYFLQGQYSKAIEILEETLQLGTEIGNTLFVAIALLNMGATYTSLQNYEKAFELLKQSLRLLAELGDLNNLAESLERLAYLMVVYTNQAQRAAVLVGASDNLRNATNNTKMPVYMPFYNRLLEIIQQNLYKADFEEAFAQGAVMDLAEITTFALATV